MPPSIWPSSACGFIALPTSWVVASSTTRTRPELDVDVDDRAVGGEGELQVRVALAVLVERVRLAVVPLDGLLDRLALAERPRRGYAALAAAPRSARAPPRRRP